jgi:hypothetical protein
MSNTTVNSNVLGAVSLSHAYPSSQQLYTSNAYGAPPSRVRYQDILWWESVVFPAGESYKDFNARMCLTASAHKTSSFSLNGGVPTPLFVGVTVSRLTWEIMPALPESDLHALASAGEEDAGASPAFHESPLGLLAAGTIHFESGPTSYGHTPLLNGVEGGTTKGAEYLRGHRKFSTPMSFPTGSAAFVCLSFDRYTRPRRSLTLRITAEMSTSHTIEVG